MRVALLVAAIFVVSTLAAVSPPPPGTTIPIDGQSKFLLGVNYPWGNYDNSNYGRDFGQNAWGYSGFGVKASSNADKFNQLRNSGSRVVRIWLFADGRAGIDLDGSGNPASVGAHVYEDIDALVNLARQYNLRLVFVLFDFHLTKWAQQNNGVQMGGRHSWINYDPHINSLISGVIDPILQRYGNEAVIHSWEVMNEPEWIIWDLPQGSYNHGEGEGVSMQQFFNWAGRICDSVHAYTNQYCTMGSASLKWYKVWMNSFAASKGYKQMNLDYYQCHYYSWMDGQVINDAELGNNLRISPLDQSTSSLGLDRPMVVGEFYSTRMGFSDQLNTYLANGYAGAWPWSVNSDYSIDYGGMSSWAQSHSGIVSMPLPPPQVGAPSTASDSELPPPKVGVPPTASDSDLPPPKVGVPPTATDSDLPPPKVGAPATASSSSSDDDSNLSKGEVAGIVIGVSGGVFILTLALVAVVVVAFIVVKRRRASLAYAGGATDHYIRMEDQPDNSNL